jgi:hypothetical protein
VRSAAIAALALLLALFGGARAYADCSVRGGEHVILYSSEDDPSVLAWDSAARLRDYHAASFDEAQALEPHALDLEPGTRALVVSCRAGYVTSQMAGVLPGDAVGVVILTGPYHGLTRWVLGTDIRIVNHKTPSQKY